MTQKTLSGTVQNDRTRLHHKTKCNVYMFLVFQYNQNGPRVSDVLLTFNPFTRIYHSQHGYTFPSVRQVYRMFANFLWYSLNMGWTSVSCKKLHWLVALVNTVWDQEDCDQLY
jgi:hypothetical protein